MPVLGSAVALSVSLSVYLYFGLMVKVKRRVRSSGVIMCAVCVASCVTQVGVAVAIVAPQAWLEGAEPRAPSWDTDPEAGVFGMFGRYGMYSLLCGMVGVALPYGGFCIAQSFLEPYVVSVFFALEPLSISLLAVAAKGAAAVPSAVACDGLTLSALAGAMFVVAGKMDADRRREYRYRVVTMTGGPKGTVSVALAAVHTSDAPSSGMTAAQDTTAQDAVLHASTLQAQ